MFKKSKVSQAVFLAVSASAISVTAQAQSVIDEVVVTATKRAESLQDVPIAVTALTGQALEELGITNFADYVMQLPGEPQVAADPARIPFTFVALHRPRRT